MDKMNIIACLRIGLLICLTWVSCDKPRYNACFTTSKDTFSIQDTVWFHNCSDFDKGETMCNWNFGENPSSIGSSMNNDSIYYIYDLIGYKLVQLRIGEKENMSMVEKTILIQ